MLGCQECACVGLDPLQGEVMVYWSSGTLAVLSPDEVEDGEGRRC